MGRKKQVVATWKELLLHEKPIGSNHLRYVKLIYKRSVTKAFTVGWLCRAARGFFSLYDFSREDNLYQ
jgi:hypothetical protein